MFSFLSRGYGTWEGIAKLEKPDSAISNHGLSSGNFILPPINQDRQSLYQPTYTTYPNLQYKIPQDDIKLPEVMKNESLHIPKTYSTKSGALLLYSEGHFKPGSRRLKKSPRLRKKKDEKSIQTLKDLTNLIMEYKKNECDPLLLAHLWRKANNSGRDLRPGFSPQRYLSHLGYTALDPDSWKKLAESGSLKSLGTKEEDGFLPLLFQDREFGEKLLRHRPQPYSTMSLPPVSPSSSMLGSFTFYKHAMSTGAASMVSMNSDSLEEFSAKTEGTYVESLAERLEEVESESGFKRSYETLSAKEKEELLTQLLMDVTLRNQGEFSPLLPENPAESPTPDTILSTLSDTKSSTKSRSKSLKSYGSSKSLKSVGSSKSLKSIESSKSLKSVSKSLKSVSKSSVFSSVCSLPPIGSTKEAEDTDSIGSMEVKHSRVDSSCSSRSGLGLTEECLTVGLDGVDFELVDNTFDLDHSCFDANGRDAEQTSTRSENAFSEQSLIEALEILEGDSVHELNDDIKSVKSLVASEKLCNSSEEDGDTPSAVKTGIVDDGHHEEDIGGDDTNFRGDGGGDGSVGDGSVGDGVGGDGVGSVNSGDGGSGVGSDDIGSDDIGSGDDGGGGGSDGGVSIYVNGGDNVGGYDGGDEDGEGNSTETNANQGQKMLHLSLTNLQEEVRLVAGQVLSRPKTGRFLVEDAKAATALLVERIEALLGPPVTTDNIRVSSATAREVRPLGQPRSSVVNTKSKTLSYKNERTIRSAGPTMASRSYVKPTNGSSPPDQEEKEDTENGTESVSSDVERLSEKHEDKDSFENGQEEIELDEKDIELEQREIELDDIVLSTSQIEESGPQPVEEASKTPSPESDFLTVTDLKSTDQPKEEKAKDEPAVKEKTESVKKAGKGKMGINAKKGNVAKGKRKKKSNARAAAQNEPPKASPFRAGLVPEGKPPKGLDLKSGEAPAKRNDKKAAQETKSASEEEKPEVEKKVEEMSNYLATPAIEKRVDSETGEIERDETPLISEKTPSPLEVSSSTEKTPSVELVPSPREKTPSPFPETISPREKTPSSREKTPSPREKTPSPREKTPSPREKTPSPREKSSPESAVGDDSGAPTRESSPEVQVAVSERVERANARAAQRAAAAERRRQEVERKRREKEETRRKAQEEEARLEELRREAGEEMKRREEDRRVQKEIEERQRRHLEAEEKERARQEKLVVERQRIARDEWKRKKEQLLAQRKLEEEMRLEREHIECEIEEERRRDYEARIAHLEEKERERLMEERRLDEERIKREIEEERLQREEERRHVLEERRRMEEELEALRDRQLARQLFLESLLKDYQNLLFDQRLSRAFTFSYFDIMPWFKETWDNLEERTSVSGSLLTASLPTVREDDENNAD